jgi:hypothetical protein
VRRGAAPAVALLAAAAVAGAVALTVGGDDRARVAPDAARHVLTPSRIYPYPDAAVRDFVDACVRSPPDEERTCRCVVDDLQTRLPYRDFAAADRAIRRGQPPSARARGAIDVATRECREAL